jgi:hypothetical protein
MKFDESAGKLAFKYFKRNSDTFFTETSGQAMYRLMPSDLAACMNHHVKQ